MLLWCREMAQFQKNVKKHFCAVFVSLTLLVPVNLQFLMPMGMPGFGPGLGKIANNNNQPKTSTTQKTIAVGIPVPMPVPVAMPYVPQPGTTAKRPPGCPCPTTTCAPGPALIPPPPPHLVYQLAPPPLMYQPAPLPLYPPAPPPYYVVPLPPVAHRPKPQYGDYSRDYFSSWSCQGSSSSSYSSERVLRYHKRSDRRSRISRLRGRKSNRDLRVEPILTFKNKRGETKLSSRLSAAEARKLLRYSDESFIDSRADDSYEEYKESKITSREFKRIRSRQRQHPNTVDLQRHTLNKGKKQIIFNSPQNKKITNISVAFDVA